MKKIIILMLAVFCHIAINAQQVISRDPVGVGEPIFSYATDGSVVVNNKFIEFSDAAPDRLDTLVCVLKLSETIDGYKVNCFRYKGWDDDPGDYDVISINDNNGKELFRFNSGDGLCYWEYKEYKAPGGIGGGSSGYPFPSPYKSFYPIGLGNGAKALVFCGVSINSDFPYVPIVVLKGGKATLVFNEKAELVNLSQPNGRLNMQILFDTMANRDSQDQPIYDNVSTITISNGVLTIFNPDDLRTNP